MTSLMSIYFHNLMVSSTTRNQHKDCNTSSLPRSRKAARHHRHRQKWCRPLITLSHMHHPLEVRYRLLMYVGPILLVSTFYSNLSKISPSPPSIFTPGPYISPEEQATWNEYNPMEVPGVKQSPAETPIYTRKQVEDMLNVVGNCFLETIVSWFNIDWETHSLSLVSKRMLSFREHKQLTCTLGEASPNCKLLLDHKGVPTRRASASKCEGWFWWRQFLGWWAVFEMTLSE